MTDYSDKKLAFIVGHYKSGSTWLAHLLSLYPGIRGVRETHIFRYVKEYPTYNEATHELFTSSAWGTGGLKGFPRYWLGKATRDLRTATGLASGTATLPQSDVPTSMLDLGILNQYLLRSALNRAEDNDEYCKLFFSKLVKCLKPEQLLVEKTPTNIFHVEDIHRIFPNSRLISIHRDGRDVVVSDKHHLSRAYNTKQSFEDRVNKWKLAMETELKVAKLFDIHQLSYEKLSSQPIETIMKLMTFLNLEHDDDIVRSLVSGASFEAMSGGRKAGHEDTSKFHRKGVVGDWQNTFSENEIKSFSELAGELLVQLDYETSPNWRDWT